MGKEIDPADIGKYPEIIKKAQSEMSNMDVLVCGQCNKVFHFVEKFREHKTKQCSKSTSLKDNLETKPVIWSFLLWKASQLSQEQSKDANAWRLYQNWMKLDEAIKETWVVAGRTIQSFAKIGQGSLQEMPVKITKTVVDNSTEQLRGRQLVTNRVVNKAPMSQKDLDASFNELKNSETSTPIGTKRSVVRTPPMKNVVSRVGTTTIQQKTGIVAREAWRTIGNLANGNVQTKEHRIEKILAKRFNPRQKEHEYLIKWDNISHENNTWEPASHLEPCPVLLDTFEKQLARQKEQRQAQAAKIAQAQSQAQHIDENKGTESGSVQSEDDASANIKRRKLESSPVKVPNKDISNMNRSVILSKAKPNGMQFVPSNEKSAEIVITSSKDGKQTGIVKKTGIPTNPVPKNEAQIKVIPKGGDSVSGVVRVGSTNQTGTTHQKVVQKLGNTTVKPVQAITRSVVKQQPKTPNTTAVRTQHVRLLIKYTFLYGITSINFTYFQVHQLTAVSSTRTGVKPTITRVVKNVANPKLTTPEQKIAALTRQGNLKITRKVVNTPSTQSIALQGDTEFNMNESFATNIEQKVDSHDQQHLPVVASQILGQVNSQSAVALIGNSQLGQNSTDIKKENDDIVMSEDQLQHLQQSGLVTDQEGLQQILAATDDGNQQLIQFVTGEDGTIYQVAGKNEQGQTILIAQGADGEQQCVYVAAEDSVALGLDDANNGVLSIDGSLVDNNSEVQQQLQQHLVAEGQNIQFSIGADEVNSVPNVNQPLTVTTEDGETQDGQITAEVVQADLPSPG